MFILLKVLTYPFIVLGRFITLVKIQLWALYITILPWHISYAMVLGLEPKEIVKQWFEGLEPTIYDTYNTYTLH